MTGGNLVVTTRFPRADEGGSFRSEDREPLPERLWDRGMPGRGPGRRPAALWRGIGRVLLWGGYGLTLGGTVGLVLGLIRAGAAGIAPGVLEGALAGLWVGALVGLYAPTRAVKGEAENGRPGDENLYFN